MNIYRVDYKSNSNSPYSPDYINVIIASDTEEQAMLLFKVWMLKDMFTSIERKDNVEIKLISDCLESKVIDYEVGRFEY